MCASKGEAEKEDNLRRTAYNNTAKHTLKRFFALVAYGIAQRRVNFAGMCCSSIALCPACACSRCHRCGVLCVAVRAPARSWLCTGMRLVDLSGEYSLV